MVPHAAAPRIMSPHTMILEQRHSQAITQSPVALCQPPPQPTAYRRDLEFRCRPYSRTVGRGPDSFNLRATSSRLFRTISRYRNSPALSSTSNAAR